ncbi:hypothetical protein NIES4106_13530 [Fischerella sp. NIES-4106]|nr:hypothetical protein NIES4106_13530 [Fischerella sp. NIES-4106]
MPFLQLYIKCEQFINTLEGSQLEPTLTNEGLGTSK